MRTFEQASEFLVASPAYLKRAAPLEQPAQLVGHETLDYASEFERRAWELVGPAGQAVSAEHTPRLVCHDFIVLRAAALAGLGIARLPESVVREDLQRGAAAACAAGVEHSAGRSAHRVPESPRYAARGACVHRFPGRAAAGNSLGHGPAARSSAVQGAASYMGA